LGIRKQHAGCWLLVIGSKSIDMGCQEGSLPDIRCWMLDARYQMLDIGSRIPDTGCPLPVACFGLRGAWLEFRACVTHSALRVTRI
jgi:hypothetical protein